MKRFLTLECIPKDINKCTKQLSKAIKIGAWIQLIPKLGERIEIPVHMLPKGPGLVISSGGSSSSPNHCLLTSAHLDQSATATAYWLQKQGIKAEHSLIFNPLPLHHLSGLMPWWRSHLWGAEHIWLLPKLMRDPIALELYSKSKFEEKVGPRLLSLVPTQIQRLLSHPSGLRWLQSFDVIWVGGAPLPADLAAKARSNQIRLAPCYGATETCAMVTILSPDEFLAGKTDCGHPLIDVELRLNKNNALQIRTPRLALGKWNNGHLEGLQDQDGWWQSGDSASLIKDNNLHRLKIIGRIDTAIHSGGETVFPEKLESKLLSAIRKSQIPVKHLIFLPISDKIWGQRLVGLFKWEVELTENEQQKQLTHIDKLLKTWLPYERPLTWYKCPELSPNSAGKWERSKWKQWLEINIRK